MALLFANERWLNLFGLLSLVLITFPSCLISRQYLSCVLLYSNPLRVIAHCDVDAAYAAFEAKRLGVNPFEQPLAVQQWNGLVSFHSLKRLSFLLPPTSFYPGAEKELGKQGSSLLTKCPPHPLPSLFRLQSLTLQGLTGSHGTKRLILHSRSVLTSNSSTLRLTQ